MSPTEVPGDDRAEFEADKRVQAAAMAADAGLSDRALDLVVESDRYGYSYQWSWLGLPIIQMPPDIIAMQEVIWATRPQVIIETGVARGGSVILSSSLLELLGEGEVIAVDIEIRRHNRQAIEEHPLAHRVHLVEGSSVDPEIVDHVRDRVGAAERVMVVLDSNHTHEHVLAELEAHASMVSPGQYLIVADTVVEHIPAQTHRPRPWGPGDNPKTALDAFLATHPEFEPDPYVNAKLLMTSSPGGYLRRRDT
jgi:cephalosporin hydroxylase